MTLNMGAITHSTLPERPRNSLTIMSDTMKAKTSTERSAKRDKEQKALGRVGRKVWATTEEHEAVKKLLIELRKS